MATKDFEVQQLLKAYRKGIISDELFEVQMKELGADKSGLDVANVLALRGDASKVSAHVLQKTPQSQTMAFTIPANFSNDRENTHKGDQIIYVVDGCAIARVSGKEQEIHAGDVLMILDADLTMPPEELPSFYDVIAGGQADYVQGTRLVYPMEPGAMRFFNKLGNVAFSQLFAATHFWCCWSAIAWFTQSMNS